MAANMYRVGGMYTNVDLPSHTLTHVHTHTQTRSSARIPPLVPAVAGLPALSFSFPKIGELSTLPVRGDGAATGCSWEGENFHQIFGSENGSGLPWRLPWPR